MIGILATLFAWRWLNDTEYLRRAAGAPGNISALRLASYFADQDGPAVALLARPYLEAKYKSYHEWGQDKAMPKGDDDLNLPFEELTRDRFLLGSDTWINERWASYDDIMGEYRSWLKQLPRDQAQRPPLQRPLRLPRPPSGRPSAPDTAPGADRSRPPPAPVHRRSEARCARRTGS